MREPRTDGVDPVIRLAVLGGLLVVGVTEALGALHALAPLPLALAWLVVALAGYRLRARWWPFAVPLARDSPASPGTSALWGIVGMVLALTFVTGFFGAPNAWDGLTYHLPRVERWAEQRHLGFWPTSVDRQLWMPPFGGYAILQFRLLTGGDRLAFLPSWLAYLGCILLCARMCRQLGGHRVQAGFAALVMATMPVAVLHASSVQTDLLAAFWVLCAASLVLRAWSEPHAARDGRHASWVGAVVALALLTKATAALALVPWLLLYAAGLARHGGAQALVRPLLIGLLAVLLVNGPHLARNLAVFGDPLGDTVARRFLRLVPWTWNGGAANLLANLSLHLGTPWPAWNAWWGDALTGIFTDVLRVSPAELFPYFGGFRVQAYSTHESLAGNAVHLALGLLLTVVLTGSVRVRREAPLVPWLVAGISAVVLHGLLIRWQPYGARLQLPSLVWMAPAAGVLVRRQLTRAAPAVALVIVAVPGIVGNYLRPLVGERSVFSVPRHSHYFAEQPGLELVVDRVTADLAAARCASVGLMSGYDSPEYLLHMALDRGVPGARIEQVGAQSYSAALEEWGRVAGECALVVVDRLTDLPALRAASGYAVSWVDGGIALLLP